MAVAVAVAVATPRDAQPHVPRLGGAARTRPYRTRTVHTRAAQRARRSPIVAAHSRAHPRGSRTSLWRQPGSHASQRRAVSPRRSLTTPAYPRRYLACLVLWRQHVLHEGAQGVAHYGRGRAAGGLRRALAHLQRAHRRWPPRRWPPRRADGRAGAELYYYTTY